MVLASLTPVRKSRLMPLVIWTTSNEKTLPRVLRYCIWHAILVCVIIDMLSEYSVHIPCAFVFDSMLWGFQHLGSFTKCLAWTLCRLKCPGNQRVMSPLTIQVCSVVLKKVWERQKEPGPLVQHQCLTNTYFGWMGSNSREQVFWMTFLEEWWLLFLQRSGAVS